MDKGSKYLWAIQCGELLSGFNYTDLSLLLTVEGK